MAITMVSQPQPRPHFCDDELNAQCLKWNALEVFLCLFYLALLL